MIQPTKPTFESKNISSANISAIAQLFPSCITESRGEDGKLKQTVDFEKLRALLGSDIAQGDESYDFTWVGKKAAMQEAGIPVRKTLRPCTKESRNWDTTQNLYIEGDNLDVLKLLQESYLKKVKMIYIDPPYNTGNDFIYNDHFETEKDEYDEGTGAVDASGIKNFQQNNDANPRFHSDWCSMIYPRLVLARNLLTDDGVVFISIDDNEVTNLKKICDEVFGESCFIGNICRATGTTTAQGTDSLGKSFDYLLIYSKRDDFLVGGLELDENDIARYNLEDERGKFSILQLRRTGNEDRREDRPNMFFGITAPDGSVIYPIGPSGYESRWRVGKDTYNKMLENNNIYFKNETNKWNVYYKFYLNGRTKRPSNLWDDIEGNKKAQIDLKEIIPEKVFDTPKPIELIKRSMQIANTSNGAIVLDFFSGSATTAHAVMQLNAEDGGNRKFIMVQLPETCAEDSEAYKAGYKTICDIGKERIRRAGDKIATELAEKEAELKKDSQQLSLDTAADSAEETKRSPLDIGFRVFKVDDSNMKDVYYSAEETSQTLLTGLESNIKEYRTDMDLLYGCLLDWGLPLSLPHTSETIDGVTVHTVNNGDLIACFNADIPESAIRTIANRKPIRAVFRDSSFATSPEKINVTEIFKTISPSTAVKVI